MRLVVVRTTAGKSLSVYDASLVSVMVPKGLAAAVLASLVLQSGLASAPIIREVAFGVILFSICQVAGLTFMIERKWLDGFFAYVFGAAPLAPAALAASAAGPQPTDQSESSGAPEPDAAN